MNALQKYLKLYQDNLINDFSRIRKVINDSSVKGGKNEKIVANFIEGHFDNKITCTNSQIIDSFGSTSDEVDVAVCNKDQPFIANDGEILICEGIDFIIQVKAILTNQELDRIIKNCKSVKKLKRKYLKQDTFQGNIGDLNYHINRIPYIVFAFESNTKINTIHQNLDLKLKNVPLELQPDAIFILNKGSLINFREGLGNSFTINEKKLIGLVGFILDEMTLLEFVRYINWIVPKIERRTKPITHYFNEQVYQKGVISKYKI
ncbi:hypothetical protein SAMN04488096_1023 [Mesonia phycicola]|uniref:DUF6602 domain-containing protein n=1 Tax=Mesonia phycicola TaxID=579105 RepID=A0A1M6BEW7_9FLAO|nr:DUF6602 domain-containing protein [Mesonia phycicola]SHI47217.1 hypothetical protein SAMN04488096_1023 [Mesonia phycicola]